MGNWIAEAVSRIGKLTAQVDAVKENRAPDTAGEGRETEDVHSVPEVKEKKEAVRTAAQPAKTVLSPEGRTIKTQKDKDTFVKVTVDNLNSLMGMAGEFLVDVRWYRPYSKTLIGLKNKQINLYDIITKISESLADGKVDAYSESYIAEARRKLSECIQMFSDRLNEFEVFARQEANLSNRFHREVLKSRMRPFSDIAHAFPRLIRDVSKKLGKKVKYKITGDSTPVDRDILQKLEAPLNHILRNALDHGIESPDMRSASGKKEEGTISVEASHRAGMLSIAVSDDGNGMNYDKLRKKIAEKHLASPEIIKNLSENELMEFLFLPGFSTTDTVTEISGRGVGLDVAYSMVQEVGGIIRAMSKPGESMTFHLQLPLTLSVIRTLMVEIAGEPYAFPLSHIDRCLNLKKEDIEIVETRQYIKYDGLNVGLVDMCQILELNECCNVDASHEVVVISDQLNHYGVVVDRFLGERDLVVQPIDSRLEKIKDISASAIMVDGSPVLIIDVEDLARSIENLLSTDRLRKIGKTQTEEGPQRKRRVLVVDDSLTVRELERRLLENNGYSVDVAVNGMDGWNAVRAGSYDLVVSDVDMPRMNGIELTGLIKNDPVLKSVPVMIVSYKDREEDKLKGLEVGANYYLTKSSFHDESFINAVADLIGKPLT